MRQRRVVRGSNRMGSVHAFARWERSDRAVCSLVHCRQPGPTRNSLTHQINRHFEVPSFQAPTMMLAPVLVVGLIRAVMLMALRIFSPAFIAAGSEIIADPPKLNAALATPPLSLARVAPATTPLLPLPEASLAFPLKG